MFSTTLSLLLYEASNKKNPALPYWKYDRFDITRLTDEECKADFRFGIAELPLLAQALKIPESFVCKNGTVAEGMEGLCILLRRYAYPCRLNKNQSASLICIKSSFGSCFCLFIVVFKKQNKDWPKKKKQTAKQVDF